MSSKTHAMKITCTKKQEIKITCTKKAGVQNHMQWKSHVYILK